jgi:uncharacterized membrane-anchored protein
LVCRIRTLPHQPLGAVLGDLLTKPVATRGFNLSRTSSSLIIAVEESLNSPLREASQAAPRLFPPPFPWCA